MKNSLVFLLYLLSSTCFSQSIEVSTDKPIEQLVNEVLLKNPPCNTTDQIRSTTGTNYNSSNGIGYFENKNPNFPIKSGVILSTGNVMNANGPNVSEPALSDGTDSWLGDIDLENTMFNFTGTRMVSKNATILEFDFLPISSKFSFDFLFASEEYGNSQCNYSDAFAFLLTDLDTGITTNLAVVPGTQIPISVETIRDKSYNSGCSDENAQYFGRFNGGSNADNSATDFNGQTVLLKATSSLNINHKYHIKLVIADREDYKYDSAIFIASESFNIGQNVLGDDITRSNGKASCYDSTYVLDSGLPDNYNIFWTNSFGIIPNQNSPKLTVSETGIYAIHYNKMDCTETIIDEIFVEFQSKITTDNPIDLYKCSNNTNQYSFDLSSNTILLKTRLDPLPVLDPLIEVSYHISQSDANNNINPLPINYSNNQITETNPLTIYARIKDSDNECFITKEFKLGITVPAIAKKPDDFKVCSDTTTFSFNLTTQDLTILNGMSPKLFSVKYFINEEDAIAGKFEIATPQAYVSGDTIIFTRVENKTDPSCVSFNNFNLKVNQKPIIDVIASITTCDKFELPILTYEGDYFTGPNGSGIKLNAKDVISETKTIYVYKKDPITGCASQNSFKVTIIKKLLPDSFDNCGPYKLPSLTLGKYYTETNGGGNEIRVGTFLTSTTKIYAYYKSPFCEISNESTITILPQVQLNNVVNIYECESYTLPELPVGPIGSEVNYYSAPNGTGNKLFAGNIINSRQTIYIYGITPNNCITEKSFEILIGDFEDISDCKPYALPNLPIGNYYSQANGPSGGGQIIPSGTVITKTQDVYFYVPSNDIENCTNDSKFTVTITQTIVDEIEDETVCESYTLPTLIVGDYYTSANGQGSKLDPTYKIFKTQKIYYFLKSNEINCDIEWDFTITVKPIPKIDSRDPIDACNQYILPPLTNGKYYNGSHENGATPELISNLTIFKSQIIYIYADATDSACTAENSFEVRVYETLVDDPEDVTSCVEYILPILIEGNYYTESAGPSATSRKLEAGTKITETATLYVYAESKTRNNCWNENSFTITIVPEPIAKNVPIAQSTFCDEDGVNDGNTIIDLKQFDSTILENQTSSAFKVEYFATQSDAALGNNPLTTSNLKTFFAKVTNTLTINQCFDISSAINIVVNKIPEPQPVGGIICYDNNTDLPLTTFTIDSGLSENLYDFEWQNQAGEVVGTNNGKFQAMQSGVYTVMATNKVTGCSSAKTPATVIKSEAAIITYSVSPDFTLRPTLTVITDGVGNYEYQLDNDTFQDNPIFTNLSSGEHNITVRDKNGCGTSTVEATIINYPRFFTPNNDGYNDTWNVTDLKDYQNTEIQIYDRFGKLLTKITPYGRGWDGIYNGKRMPSTDYWFVIYFEKEGVQKIFKAHFSLKR